MNDSIQPRFRAEMLSESVLEGMGVSLREFALECHCSTRTLGKYRDRTSVPGGDILNWMSQAFRARGISTSAGHLMSTEQPPGDFSMLTKPEVLAPYLARLDVKARFVAGVIIIAAGSRQLDVAKDCDGWLVVRFDDGHAGEAVRVLDRAALDAHVRWCAGEAS